MVFLSYEFFPHPCYMSITLLAKKYASLKACSIRCLHAGPKKKNNKAPGRFRNIVHSRAPKAHITSYTHEKQMNIFFYSLGAKDGAMK